MKDSYPVAPQVPTENQSQGIENVKPTEKVLDMINTLKPDDEAIKAASNEISALVDDIDEVVKGLGFRHGAPQYVLDAIDDMAHAERGLRYYERKADAKVAEEEAAMDTELVEICVETGFLPTEIKHIKEQFNYLAKEGAIDVWDDEQYVDRMIRTLRYSEPYNEELTDQEILTREVVYKLDNAVKFSKESSRDYEIQIKRIKANNPGNAKQNERSEAAESMLLSEAFSKVYANDPTIFYVGDIGELFSWYWRDGNLKGYYNHLQEAGKLPHAPNERDRHFRSICDRPAFPSYSMGEARAVATKTIKKLKNKDSH